MNDDKERAMKLSEKITFKNWIWDYESIVPLDAPLEITCQVPSTILDKIITPLCENAARITIGQIIEDKAWATWRGDEISIDFGPLNVTFTKADLQDDSDMREVEGDLAGEVEIKPTGEWKGE